MWQGFPDDSALFRLKTAFRQPAYADVDAAGPGREVLRAMCQKGFMGMRFALARSPAAKLLVKPRPLVDNLAASKAELWRFSKLRKICMHKSFMALAFLAFCPLVIAQQALNNDSVIKLVKAGLSDDLIVSTINASPGTYDTSVEGLIALKSAGVSDKVLPFKRAKPLSTKYSLRYARTALARGRLS